MIVFLQSSEALQVDGGETSKAATRSIHTREPSDVSPSSFLSRDAVLNFRKLGLPCRECRLRSRGGIGFKLVLSAIASAAAVAVLISLCAAAHLQAASLQRTRRSLSEGEPFKPTTGVAACGEASGEGSGEGPQVSFQEEEVVPPSAKKAKVKGEDSDANAEAGTQAQTSGSGQKVFSSDAGGAAAPAREAGPPLQRIFSPEEVMAAEALTALWTERASALELQAQLPPVPQHQQQLDAAPQQQAAAAPPLAPVPIPEACLDEPSQKALPERSWGVRESFLSSKERLESIDPLGEWEPPPPSEADGHPILEHAFSRLPRVAGCDPGALRSLFDAERAVSHVGIPKLKVHGLQKLSALLLEEELSFGQMRQVAALTEQFVSHMTLYERMSLPPCPSYAVEALGFRFLVLEMTVSALHLLGVPPSGPWWDNMVSRIPDEYTRPFTRWDETLPSFNANLMTRLTEAIRMLKAGQRPAPNVVVHLKRCLFCCIHSPIRFLRPGWDPWREDDEVFYQQFGGRPRRGDPAQPGPSHQSGS
ncbi:hypothetical protein ACSSS7_000401 [Eimeria intestinalis]